MGTAAAARGAQKLHVSSPRAGAGIATGTSIENFMTLSTYPQQSQSGLR